MHFRRVKRTLQSKVTTKSHFWPDRPIVTMKNWVYNAENFCVSFFNQVASIFHLRGGEIKKKSFFGPYLMKVKKLDFLNKNHSTLIISLAFIVWKGASEQLIEIGKTHGTNSTTTTIRWHDWHLGRYDEVSNLMYKDITVSLQKLFSFRYQKTKPNGQ